MSNIILTLHVHEDPDIRLRGFDSLDDDGNIQYIVDEYTQVTLPNYNTVYKEGYVLAGWCEKDQQTRTDGSDPIYAYYYEPIENHCDLYPIWVANANNELGLKSVAITSVMGTVTTVTVIGSLSDEERVHADAAVEAFNNMVDTKVVDSVGTIVREEIGSIVEETVGTIVREEFEAWSADMISTINQLDLRLGSTETDIESLVISSNTQGEKINGLIGSVTILETSNAVSVGSIQSLEQANIANIGSINALKTSVADMAVQLSTQAIQEKAGATASDIAYKMANTVTFRLDGVTPTEAVCTLSTAYDYKRVKTLADYKNSPDYNFGTNVIWYNNGVVMNDLDPITSGSVLIGVEPAARPEIYALPVVDGTEGAFDIKTVTDQAATNFGVTYVTCDETLEFDSMKSYNPCVVSTLKQVVTLLAKEFEGAKFEGWYSVVPENGYVKPEYLITKEQEYKFEATEDAQYGALFKGDLVDTFYEPIGYEPFTSPGYYVLYESTSMDTFDKDSEENEIPLDFDSWTPMGTCTTLSYEEIPQSANTILIIAPEGRGSYGAYKQPEKSTEYFNDINADGCGTLARDSIRAMLESKGITGPYDMVGTHTYDIDPGKSVSLKITAQGE